MLKAYTAAAKDFIKERKKALKILKKINLDRTTSWRNGLKLWNLLLMRPQRKK